MHDQPVACYPTQTVNIPIHSRVDEHPFSDAETMGAFPARIILLTPVPSISASGARSRGGPVLPLRRNPLRLMAIVTARGLCLEARPLSSRSAHTKLVHSSFNLSARTCKRWPYITSSVLPPSTRRLHRYPCSCPPS